MLWFQRQIFKLYWIAKLESRGVITSIFTFNIQGPKLRGGGEGWGTISQHKSKVPRPFFLRKSQSYFEFLICLWSPAPMTQISFSQWKKENPFNPIWPAPSIAEGKFCSAGFVACFCTPYLWLIGKSEVEHLMPHSVANHFLFKQNNAALNTSFKTL